MKKIVFTACFIFLLASIIPAQKELSFDFDYARFNYDSSSVYIEFYYELNPRNMKVIPTDKGGLIEAVVHLELKNLATNQYEVSKDWKIQNIVSSAENDSLLRSIGDVIGFVIPGGKYTLMMSVYDAKNPSLAKSVSETIIADPVMSAKYSISDVEIARNIKIEGVDQKSLYYKNSLEVYPNPTMVYTSQTPAMFFYAELYNLKLTDEKATFSLHKNLYNSAGTPVYRNTKNIKQSTQSVVEYGVVNLSKYQTDSYTFELSLVDPQTQKGYISTKRFYLYNPTVVDTTRYSNMDAGVIGSEFGLYNVDECNKMFLYTKYIASQKEINQFSKLDSLNAKREFLYNFWKIRDENPSTPKNEFKEEYMNRVASANKNFTRMNKEGYLTDRGRIVLLYGEPDQKDYFPSEAEMKPYEVWFYNQLEGGVSFIFGDISGFGNYELVHSTKRGELQDENWMRRIRTAVQ